MMRTELPGCIQRNYRKDDLVPVLKKLNPTDVYQSKDKNFMYYSFVYVVGMGFIPILNDGDSDYAWNGMDQA